MGGVAYLAHVGGVATGVLLGLFFRDRAEQVRARNRENDGWFYGPP
jgi:membrane associated rhomboid family serine protease